MMTPITRQMREQLLQLLRYGLAPEPSAKAVVGFASGRVVE